MGREESKKQEQVVHRKQRSGVEGKVVWRQRERGLLIWSEDQDSRLLWVWSGAHPPTLKHCGRGCVGGIEPHVPSWT